MCVVFQEKSTSNLTQTVYILFSVVVVVVVNFSFCFAFFSAVKEKGLRSMKSTSTRRGKINFTKLVKFKWRLATQNISKIFTLRQKVSQLRFDSILQDQVPTYQSKNSFDKTTHISKVCCLCVFTIVIPDIKNNKNWLSTCQPNHSCQLIDLWLLTTRTS